MKTQKDPRPAGRASPKYGRARTTNDPLTRHNGDTPRGKRVRDLYREFMARLGNPADVIVQAAVLAAAELTVICEDRRAEILAGGGGRRALEALRLTETETRLKLGELGLSGLQGAAKPKPPKPPKTPKDRALAALEGRP